MNIDNYYHVSVNKSWKLISTHFNILNFNVLAIHKYYKFLKYISSFVVKCDFKSKWPFLVPFLILLNTIWSSVPQENCLLECRNPHNNNCENYLKPYKILNLKKRYISSMAHLRSAMRYFSISNIFVKYKYLI